MAGSIDGGFVLRAAGAIALLAASIFLLRVTVERPSSGMGLAAGGALALAAACVPAALLFAPAFALPLADRRYPPAVRRALAGSGFLGLALGLAAALLLRHGFR
jgi:hypothetical protein